MGARGPFFRVEDVKELLDPYYKGYLFPLGDNSDYRRWFDIRELRQEQVGYDVADKLCIRLGRPDLMVHLEPV